MDQYKELPKKPINPGADLVELSFISLKKKNQADYNIFYNLSDDEIELVKTNKLPEKSI